MVGASKTKEVKNNKKNARNSHSTRHATEYVAFLIGGTPHRHPTLFLMPKPSFVSMAGSKLVDGKTSFIFPFSFLGWIFVYDMSICGIGSE